jgi:hypothetical protein
MLIVIDCKDYARPVNVTGVEAFHGLVDDVGANRGALVCPAGFSKSAKARALGYQIDLYSPVDTDPHKWQVKASVPAVCDFRLATISFGISSSEPVPFFFPHDFYSSLTVFDGEQRALGTPLNAALTRWNESRFPKDLGVH